MNSHEFRAIIYPNSLLVQDYLIVMDNATFHKGGRIRELIEKAGCQLLYLPPYSPDFNKIEQC